MSQITVKAYLKRGGQQKRLLEQSDEIRRFAVDCDVSTSYEYLLAKITSVFSGLGNKSITLYWKDSDGDMVAFSSDDELMEALKSVTDGMFRVYIVENKRTNQWEPAAPIQNDSANELHFGVSCDGCNGEVRGIRYKCKVCPDYDLCMGCKAKSIHSEHEMITIEKPVHCYGVGRGAPLGRFFAAMSSHPGMPQSAFGFHMPPPPPPSYGCFSPQGPGVPPAPGMPPMSPSPGMPPAASEQPECADACHMNRKAWKRWYKETYGHDHKRKCKKEKKEKKEKSKEKKEGKSSSSSSSESEVESPTGEYLKHVGHSVAAMLDPLGIDVEVDVEHHGRRRRCHRGMPRFPYGQWGMHGYGAWGMRGRGGRVGFGFGCPYNSAGMASQGPMPAAAATGSSQNSSGQKSSACTSSVAAEQSISGPSHGCVETNLETGEMPNQCRADQDWMVVNAGGSPAADIECATDGVRDLNVNDAAGPEDLMSFSMPSDPVVADALGSMMSMGYTNEGGWLTALLTHHGGDIGRALDAIHAKK